MTTEFVVGISLPETAPAEILVIRVNAKIDNLHALTARLFKLDPNGTFIIF